MACPAPDALLQLPVEIIVNIVKQLEGQPGGIESLLRSCKTIKFILKSYEKHLSEHFTSHLDTSSPHNLILSSEIPARPIISRSLAPSQPRRMHSSCFNPPIRHPYTFPWAFELHRRDTILSHLHDSVLLDLSRPESLSLFQTSHHLCPKCNQSGLHAFRHHGLNALLKLSDARIRDIRHPCTIEEFVTYIDCAHRNQEHWILQLDLPALTNALALVWLASRRFNYGDRTTWGSGTCEHNGHNAHSSLPADSPVMNDYDDDLVERQCIYREMALTHGPYFVWCSEYGSVAEKLWVKETLDEGVNCLKEYESGVRPVQRSLQSVCLRRLIELRGCEIWNAWDDVFTCVSDEIVQYGLKSLC